MNWYAYVGNDPINAIDPSGKAKVYTWNAGKIANGANSLAGHAAFVADDGTYLSMFPKENKFSSPAEFHTYEQDVAIYGREPDVIFDVGLTDEKSANEYAKSIKSDSSQIWNLNDNNCATVTVNALNAGGTNLPTNGTNTPVQLDYLLGTGADAPRGMTAISVVRVTGRLKSQNKSITEEK